MLRPLTAVVALAALAPAPRLQDTPADLAIRRIVLYKHGVGYFERQGAVRGDATIPLAFKTTQMQDVLKSLFAVDLDGGRVAEVLYDSKDPISKQLEDILFRVPEGQALTAFLMQLKGARVRVALGERTIEGAILGIEPVQRQTEAGVVTTHRLVLLREGAIESFELLDAAQIAILDDTVRADLGRMMEIFAKARYADRKVVNLRVTGTGEHRVRVGYIIETPIWKTSYRLLLDAGAPPLLQGWAIVENRTDEDWKDVQLTFVAGSPLSFVLDLYTSYYPQRPVLDPGLGAAAEGAAAEEVADKDMAGAMRARRNFAAKALAPSEPSTPAPGGAFAPSMGELVTASIAPLTQGVSIGELFAYEAKGPVTIHKGQAALVPILLEQLPKAQRTLYYRGDLSKHPSHAVRLVNSTALTLEKGPVTVFESGACLGEAMLTRTLQTGMNAMLPYALETGVEVEVRGDIEAKPATRGVLAAGVLTLVNKQVRTMRYAVRNKTGSEHVLYIDHTKAGSDYTLVSAAAEEEVEGWLRFKTTVAANGTVELAVSEERTVSTQVALANQSLDQIRFFSRQPFLSQDARELLARLAGWMEERAELERRATAASQEREKLVADQDNVRRNLGVLQQNPEERRMRDRLLQRLTEAMERVDALDKETAALNAQRAELDARVRAELEKYRDA